jgi:3-methyladenine DNA glycosylase AlkD
MAALDDDRTSAEGRMHRSKKQVTAKPTDVSAVIAWLQHRGKQSVRTGMARFAIPADKAFGIPVGDLRKYAKELGRDHELAAKLWESGWYEARLLAAFVAEPARVTPAEMDRWCQDFDSWAVCDTVCFHLYDRTPHAWAKIKAWAKRKPEFEKRAAFALLASVALHDKESADDPFAASLPLIERAATDERNFVKKAVVWALRGIAGRNPALQAAAAATAERLASSSDKTARWVGLTTLRELRSPASTKRLAKQKRRKSGKATTTANRQSDQPVAPA